MIFLVKSRAFLFLKNNLDKGQNLVMIIYLQHFFNAMKTLRYIVLALIFLILVAVVVGFFLPSKVHLERSVEINREQVTIFKVVNALENFNKWSPWYELDVNAEYSVSGPQSGVGSKLEWHGNESVGDGVNEIVESVKNNHIKTKMFFGKNDAPAYSIISLEQKGGNTKVTWAFENDFGMNIFYRYFGLVIEDMIAPDYEKGLKKLKTYVESLPKNDFSPLSIVTTPTQAVYTFESLAKIGEDDVSKIIGEAYQKIISFLVANNIEMSGTPKIINLSFDEKHFEFLAAIPVANNDKVDVSATIKPAQMYAGKAVKLIHKGSYKNFKKSYEVLNEYLAYNKLEKNGNSWEDYVTDPGNVSESDLITHIYQPIK
jgi:effector-binding domain-containing protein